MRITWNELTVSPDGIDFEMLLSDWRWLVDASFEPVVISSMGDLFLKHADGRVFWLSTAAGELVEVASDVDDFKQKMVQKENAAEWFQPQLVGNILAQGKQLTAGEVFSPTVPMVLGGELAPDNFEATDMHVHFGMLGQIHVQVKDLPPGTTIGDIAFEDDAGEGS